MSSSAGATISGHFDTLGLKHDASEADIKKAYRKLAIKLHPDKNPNLDPEVAAARFHPIQVAYDALLDPKQRAAASERAKENAAREERMSQFQGKRKSAAEDLMREEERYAEKRRKESRAAEEREAKLARLKEEGRRKVEARIAEREAATAAAAAASSATTSSNSKRQAASGDASRKADDSIPTGADSHKPFASTHGSSSDTRNDRSQARNAKGPLIFSFKSFPSSSASAAKS
ncbi:hypothetical protein OC846_004148 [Tilletia horrida]|uniref:J domain-containing protein n=1 Tax=Tilletia horrida TaxID=155126 RepID=A0AAN6GNQ9_9BASI|nr:hypothetical protein OC846_004148 [Tilletia horrida]